DTSWVAAWTALGDRLAQAAQDCDAAGHRVSAASAWLRAAVAYSATLNTLAGTEGIDALLPPFRRHRAAWSRFCELQSPRWEPVAIPYEGRTLPGWFAPYDGSGKPRRTLILNNGSDGPISSMLMFGGGGARARGYHLLFFDGPGQQSQLFLQSTYFRHDWEAVITPVVDFLRARPDVDPEAIALYGVSQAGYWVPRALAFEHRIAAAVADTGVVDVSQSWLRHFPKEMIELIDRGDKDTFNRILAESAGGDAKAAAQWTFRSRPYGSLDPYSTFAEVRKYRLDPADAARITTPLLVTDPEDEQFWPGQAEKLAAMTPGVSTLVRFTAAEGANFHCEPMARLLVDQRMFDWLDERLRK
ncbi:MAG: dipeptidyl aminopeptidase, partial [Burkholderiales bacterium]|nr:dipeptidyl aminopeptidase [Burkholderiales bacterium]